MVDIHFVLWLRLFHKDSINGVRGGNDDNIWWMMVQVFLSGSRDPIHIHGRAYKKKGNAGETPAAFNILDDSGLDFQESGLPEACGWRVRWQGIG